MVGGRVVRGTSKHARTFRRRPKLRTRISHRELHQKLNTRSSTETEIVGADDFMPAICWTRYFLEAQGYTVKDNVLFQDNKSAILLEENGKASSSKRTKHINVRYFFITDRVQQGDVSIEWCPTGDMTGDYMTKPLQGALFRKFRDQIMGVVPARDPGPGKAKSSTTPSILRTPTVRPSKGKRKPTGRKVTFSLAPLSKAQRHRSVLERVSRRLKGSRRTPGSVEPAATYSK